MDQPDWPLTGPSQSLYPTMIVILVARHKTPLSDELTSIEPLTVGDVESQDFLSEDVKTISEKDEIDMME